MTIRPLLACLALCFAASASLPACAQDADTAPAAAKARRAAPRKPAPKPAAATPAAPASVPGGSSATLVATFTDWSAYTAQTGKSKICYALSQPKARAPATIKDTPGYLFVSFRPSENVRNEVATVLGFPTKETTPGDIAVGSTNYAVVTKGANGWIKNPAEEPQAIATMSKGQSMTVSVTSARGNKTTDRYSLSGFAQALDRAKKECP